MEDIYNEGKYDNQSEHFSKYLVNTILFPKKCEQKGFKLN